MISNIGIIKATPETANALKKSLWITSHSPNVVLGFFFCK